MIKLNNITLYKEQQKAVNKALTKDNFALFMGAGTGKTFTALTILINKPNITICNIICPKSVKAEWEKSIEYIPNNINININIYGLETFAADKLIKGNRKAVNKQYIKDKYNCDMLIVDEVHRCKNEASNSYKKLKSLTPKYKLFLTGTPSEGKGWHYVVIGQLLNDMFGNLWKFKKEKYILDHYNNIIKPKPTTDEFIKYKWSNYCIKINKITFPFKLKRHKILLDNLNDNIYHQCNKYYKIKNKDGSFMVMPNKALRMFKEHTICSGFYKDNLSNLRILKHNPKLNWVEDFLLKHKKEKIIIFINYKYEAYALEQLCLKSKLSYLRLDGSTNNTIDYINEVKEFNYDILIVNYKSGGVGLTLTKSSTMILYSLPFSFIYYDQAIKRIYRLSQTKNCNIYHLCIKTTIDELILDSLKLKKDYHNKQFKNNLTSY